MSDANLSPLQVDFIRCWFAHSKDFFLTGGGALVGYLGAPRATVHPDAFARAGDLLHQVCSEIGVEARSLRTSAEFHRYQLNRDEESTILDLVLDRAPQIFPSKEDREGDPPLEILVNKICAVVSRSEPRDFVDVWFLCQQGYDRMEALRLSSRKDGGVGPDTLLWILRDLKWEHFRVPDLPDEVVRETVRFFQEWMEELALDLHPGP